MTYREICRILAVFVLGFACVLLFPLGIALYYEWIQVDVLHPQLHSAAAFLTTILISVAIGILFYLIGRRGNGQMGRRDALILVVFTYFLMSWIGSLPFWLSGTLSNPIDAFFETASGLTTTGATVFEAKKYDSSELEIPIQTTINSSLPTTYRYFGTVKPVEDSLSNIKYTGVEAIGKGLLFWRCFIQWLGGGGIIVLFIAVLPALGVGGKMLYQAEISGVNKESLAPRIKDTASQLWKIYVGLTALQILLLMFTNRNMPFFDALTIALSTISTGGFSIKNANISAYANAPTEWIILIFMILGGISFMLYFYCFRGKFLRINDPELKLFLLIIVISSIFAAWQLKGQPMQLLNGQQGFFSLIDAIRYGSFQVVSAQTSTGFTIANYDIWPFPLQAWLLILMFIGAMAGSTAGGLKIIRLQALFKILRNKIESLFSPDMVRVTRIGNAPIDEQISSMILAYVIIAIIMTVVGVFALMCDGVDPETALGTITCMVNNTGMSFRMGSGSGSFAFLSNFGKILSIIWMVAGRLEFFALLSLLIPSFWRKT